MEDLAPVIMKFVSAPVLITAGYALFIYRKLAKELQVFSWFLFLSAIVEVASKILWFQSRNNMPLLHFYVAAGFFLLALFYQRVLNDFINKKIIRVVLIIFLTFTIINSLAIQPLTTFNSYALTLESVLIIILSLSTFILMMDDIVRKKRLNIARSLNWINSGLFIYYLSSLLIFYFGDLITLLSPSHLVKYTWVIHAFFSFIMYCCFFVGLWCRQKN